MEQTFELVVDEATLAEFGVPLDAVTNRGDVIPADPSGFDEEAWFAELTARFGSTTSSDSMADPMADPAADTMAAAVERTLCLRAQLSRLIADEQRELAGLASRARWSLPSDAKPKDVELAMRSLIAELAVAHRVSDRTMATRLAEAETLVSRFPATLTSLGSGTIQMGHVRTIVEHGVTIADADARALYEETVLRRAVAVTPGRLRRFAQLAAARLGEVSFEDRHAGAREERSLTVTEVGDGMSQITHVLPTLLAEGVWDRLTRQAKAIHNAGDPRTYDQIRSDLAAELLLTGQPSGDPDAPHAPGVGIRAEVSVVIPMLSLLDQSSLPGGGDEPVTIAGKGPIDLDTARRLAAEAPSLVRILTHPVTGMALAVDTYRPSEQLRRFLRTRDGRCRFPSCNRAARRCDIDHTLDWDYGGKTRPGNLECLCRGHHTLKHYRPEHVPPWRVRQTVPGVLEWTSPLGRTTTDLPDTVLPGTGPRFTTA